MHIEINPLENRLSVWATDLESIDKRVFGNSQDRIELRKIAGEIRMFLDGYKSKSMEVPDTYTVTYPKED